MLIETPKAHNDNDNNPKQFKSQEAKQARPALHTHAHTHAPLQHACTHTILRALHMHARMHECTHAHLYTHTEHISQLFVGSEHSDERACHKCFIKRQTKKQVCIAKEVAFGN